MKFGKGVMLVLLVIAMLPASLGSTFPHNFHVNTTEGASFNIDFTIFNDKNVTIFYNVLLPPAEGWKITADSPSGLISPGNAKTVKITFRVPGIVSKHNWNFTIKIEEYSQSGYLKSEYVYVSAYVSSAGFYNFHIPFPKDWGYWARFLNSLIFWVIITLAIFVIFPLLKRAVKITKTKVDDILIGILHKPVTLWIISYGIMVSILQFPLSGDVINIIYIVYRFITISIVTWIIYKIFRELIINYALHYSERKGRMERSIISTLDKIGVVSIITIYGIMVLSIFGINVTVLLASVGILGIILGLAAQDTLSNFFSGIHILLDKSIQVGDYIILENEDTVYRVRDVGLRSTKLYDIFSHTIIYIPNSILANHKITNLSRPDRQLKIRINVGVSYRSDVNKVKRILLDVAMRNPHVLKEGERKPQVIFREFGESSLNFILYVWVDRLTDQWIVASNLREEILNAFRKEGIEIPYPQVDVHIKKD